MEAQSNVGQSMLFHHKWLFILSSQEGVTHRGVNYECVWLNAAATYASVFAGVTWFEWFAKWYCRMQRAKGSSCEKLRLLSFEAECQIWPTVGARTPENRSTVPGMQLKTYEYSKCRRLSVLNIYHNSLHTITCTKCLYHGILRNL